MERILSLSVAVLVLLAGVGQAIEIETVPIGNPGNAGEWSGESYGGYGTDRICGAVDYVYHIGKYEVTAGQYCEFLNDVAASDPYGLYSSYMNRNWDDVTPPYSPGYSCRITQNGESGSYTYDFSGAPTGSAADWENRPVNYISWYDAAMFCNWMTSGDIHQGAYDTSAEANWNSSDASWYTGVTAHDSAAMDALVATYGKVWFLPTEDEWYKAAYYDPDLDDGVGGYHDYATGSDTAPGFVNDLGDLSGTGAPFTEGGVDPGSYATYDGDAGTWGIGAPYVRTEVGEWENSASPYGTFDQGGNVQEWNETLVGQYWEFQGEIHVNWDRGSRGGSFRSGDALHASSRESANMRSYSGGTTGFRIAFIPEPSTLVLLALGVVGLLVGLWRRW